MTRNYIFQCNKILKRINNHLIMGERIVAGLRTDFAFSVILQICPVTNTVNSREFAYTLLSSEIQTIIVRASRYQEFL